MAPKRHAGADAAGVPVVSRRRAQTRERVLDAARAELAERGVFGATVEDICARAGFTRGAFYSNFADKGDMLHALVEQEHAALLRHLDLELGRLDVDAIRADAGDGGLGAVAEAELERLLRALPVDRSFFLIQAELQIHALRDPLLIDELRAAQASFRQRIAEVLLESALRIGRELIVDVGDATDAILAIAEGSIRRSLLADGGADPMALARVTLPLLLASLTRPARRP